MSPQPPRAKVRWYGALRVTMPDGTTETIRRGAVAEFEDTAGLEVALNSGFAPLDFGDDTVAVVLAAPKE